jgi:hypothetical protein
MTNAEATTTNIDATVAQTGATVAPQEPAPRKAATSKKGAPKGHKAAKAAKPGKAAGTAKKGAKAAERTKKAGVRQGSKTAKVLDLLKRPGGATMKELMKATGWQAHSVRGFLSGTLGKKRGLTVMSTKNEGGERSYAVKK